MTTTATYEDSARRLSRQSVDEHFDAYSDVDWDGTDTAEVDPDDPRFELPTVDPRGATAWYGSQPPHTRARIGLHDIVAAMEVGEQFERVLKRGMSPLIRFLPTPFLACSAHAHRRHRGSSPPLVRHAPSSAGACRR
jgi:hypothetical protein